MLGARLVRNELVYVLHSQFPVRLYAVKLVWHFGESLARV